MLTAPRVVYLQTATNKSRILVFKVGCRSICLWPIALMQYLSTSDRQWRDVILYYSLFTWSFLSWQVSQTVPDDQNVIPFFIRFRRVWWNVCFKTNLRNPLDQQLHLHQHLLKLFIKCYGLVGRDFCTTPGWLEWLCWSLCITHKYSNKVQINKWPERAGWVGVIWDLRACVLRTDNAETPQTLYESSDATQRWELWLWRWWALIYKAHWAQHYQYSIQISFFISSSWKWGVWVVFISGNWERWCALVLFRLPSKDLLRKNCVGAFYAFQ